MGAELGSLSVDGARRVEMPRISVNHMQLQHINKVLEEFMTRNGLKACVPQLKQAINSLAILDPYYSGELPQEEEVITIIASVEEAYTVCTHLLDMIQDLESLTQDESTLFFHALDGAQGSCSFIRALDKVAEEILSKRFYEMVNPIIARARWHFAVDYSEC